MVKSPSTLLTYFACLPPYCQVIMHCWDRVTSRHATLECLPTHLPLQSHSLHSHQVSISVGILSKLTVPLLLFPTSLLLVILYCPSFLYIKNISIHFHKIYPSVQ